MSLNDITPEAWDKVAKVKSDGGSSEYYEIPEWARELDDLIVYKKMPWHIANIFKACYRYDEKEGSDAIYDCQKIKWFIDKHITDIKAGRMRR